MKWVFRIEQLGVVLASIILYTETAKKVPGQATLSSEAGRGQRSQNCDIPFSSKTPPTVF